jgi:uncharacterized protein
MKPNFPQYRFAHQENLIMAGIGGSQAHGAKLGATDDTDWDGLYIPPRKVFGPRTRRAFRFHDWRQSRRQRTTRCGCVSLYSYKVGRTRCEKAIHPPYHFLFMQLQFRTNTWDYFTARPEIFLAKGHVEPFLGFANDQMKRLLGRKGQKNVHRAELETKFGYDTKYAMHIVRRYGKAKELMESGRITLPRPNREELIEIRLGKYTLAEIRELSLQLEGLHRPRRHFPMRWAGMPLIGFSPILTFDFGALEFFGILVRLS